MSAEPTALLFTKRQTAGYLSVSERQVSRLVSSGRLNPVHIGPRCVRFDRRDIERFIASAKATAVGAG